ncbi:hypothetical protein ACQU0X_26175 [Pseudovibrio ascidiaceicola]|uniref:hypothetical protein n=1 Tax=Pseudovibrio ascidiaceicola TaxID=285279 RepID=UPI003D365FF9
MSPSKKLVVAVAVFAQMFSYLLFSQAAFAAASDNPSGRNTTYMHLDNNLTQLKEQFNKDKGKVRVVAILGPTCGGCLLGMRDVNNALLEKEKDNPDLVTYLVYVPTLGAQEQDISNTKGLITSDRVYEYWDETGEIGKEFQSKLGLDDYIWDAWFVFDSDAQWNQTIPDDYYWMRRATRGTADDGAPLNGNAFAEQVNELLSSGR